MSTPRTAPITQTRVPSSQTQTRVPSSVSTPRTEGVAPVVRTATGNRPVTGTTSSLPPRTTPTPVTRTSPMTTNQRAPVTATATPTRTAPVVATTRTGAAPTVTPVSRQPSGLPSGTPPSSALGTRTRTATGADQQPVAPTRTAASAQTRTAPVTAQRAPTGASSATPSREAVRAVADSRAVTRARRVSKVIVEKEKKTEYWQEIIEEARLDAPELTQDDVNAMIARCLSLELVGNWKMREQQGNGPKARELFGQLSSTMEAKLIEKNGGKPVAIPGTGFTKIKNMERQLQLIESKAEKAQEEEAEKVKAKISELSKSLTTLQQKKENERETNRRTMTLEISNLREQMLKAAQDNDGNSAQLAEENKKMAQKMARLEAALRQMNEERKKGVDDNDTAMLKKKLALFEARMKQLEDEKKMQESEEHSDHMRDKLLLMEEKLAKMERRKSVSITMMMQQKMQQVEEQLSTLRSTGGGGDSAKIAALEKKLVEMQNTKVNPSMINDPETRALRSHVKKMEEAMLAAEAKMEADRLKLEEERNLQLQKRQREEEAYRKKAQQREQLLLDKMGEMEKRIAAAASGGGKGAAANPNMDAAIQKRMEEMEKRLQSGNAFADKFAEMEKRLRETEERLQSEKATSMLLMQSLGEKQGPELEAAEKDIKIALLTQTTEQLMARLDGVSKQMDDRFSAFNDKLSKLPVGGGGGAAVVHKSGLSYEEINKKLEEIQTKLFNPDIDEKESEVLNIEYEKLISELESTAEYKAEQEAIAKKWKDENTPLNAAALERVKAEIASWPPMKKTAQLKRKPELKFLDFTPDQINKKHVNDFKGVTTQNLTLDEARAIFHNMPEFRKDQEAQLQFVGQLKDKIEIEAKKPAKKPPPPIKASKPLVFKKPPPAKGGGDSDFLGELLRKRKPQG